ncbi:MAG TPA: alpha/beta fold hydrolase [Rhodocyclaceae bacterium]|nr:alpha/beta fold hydrolase [Rhodocyclaceae bacterium]
MKDINLHGGRHAVLLLHGLYGNPQEMGYVGRKLHKAGYSVHIPYIQGCGVADSPWQHRRTRWEHWAAQVEAKFDELKREYDHVSVAGLCAGADMALTLAIKRSEDIHSLCLYATTLFFDGWSIGRLRFARALAYYTPLRYVTYFRERAPYGLKDVRIRNWIAAQMEGQGKSDTGASKLSMVGVYQTERMMRHLRANLHRVTVPTLILHAREDDTTSLRSADLVEAKVSSSLVRKVVLENSYHIITLDNDKDVVVRETLDFVARDAGASTFQEPVVLAA